MVVIALQVARYELTHKATLDIHAGIPELTSMGIGLPDFDLRLSKVISVPH